MSSVPKLQEFWETLKIQYVPAGRQLLTKVNNVKTSVEKLFRKNPVLFTLVRLSKVWTLAGRLLTITY